MITAKETSMSSFSTTPTSAQALTLRVEGMHCESCVTRVEKAISQTPGVVSASVDLAAKRARVTYSGAPDSTAVIDAISDAGYESSIENSPA